MKLPQGVETQAVGQVTRHARGPHRARELLICTNSDMRRKIGSSLGSSQDAALTWAMLRHLRVGGRCRLWQNHPSYGSLSITDWRLALRWVGIEEIAAVNEAGTWFWGSIRDRLRLTRAVEPFVASRVTGMAGAVPTTIFEDATVASSMALTSTQDFQLNLYLDCFATHAVNVAMARLGIIQYQTTLSGPDIQMNAKSKVKIAMHSAVNVSFQYLSANL